MQNIVGGVIGPGAKTEITHLHAPGPVAVGDPLTQDLKILLLSSSQAIGIVTL